jgi:hypothetical protein
MTPHHRPHKPLPKLPPKRIKTNKQNNKKRDRATDLPEKRLVLPSVGYALEVHAEIGREEGERQEDDGDAGEQEDGFILAVGHDGELVLLD